MRVIAGSARRIQLEVAEGTTARPLLEMARGALFNSMAAHVPDARVLDLYAGSGSLGIEALSRGAAQCLFVEADPRSAAMLERNLAACKLSDCGVVRTGRVGRVLPALDGPFDLIFIDPPFAQAAEWQNDPEGQLLLEHGARLLAPGGRLIYRYEHKTAQTPPWPGLELNADRRYGRSRLCVYTTPDV